MSTKLTTSQVVAHLGCLSSNRQAMGSARQIAHATLDNEARGPVWRNPETDLDGFEPPQTGRPRKFASTETPATAKAGASNVPVSKKKASTL